MYSIVNATPSTRRNYRAWVRAASGEACRGWPPEEDCISYVSISNRSKMCPTRAKCSHMKVLSRGPSRGKMGTLFWPTPIIGSDFGKVGL